VLYELVAPEGTRVNDRAAEGGSPISALQVGMKDVLELQFQLDHINYDAENFVHADMSPEEFVEDMEKRGDSLMSMAFRMMGAGLAMQGANSEFSDVSVLSAMLADDRARQMKRTFAKQMVGMEGQMMGMADKNGKSTLLTERNAKCFEVLDKQMQLGRKKIGVFYGAAHLPDMAIKLVDDRGFVPGRVEWMQAWDLMKK
jgi:hypothetical protein